MEIDYNPLDRDEQSDLRSYPKDGRCNHELDNGTFCHAFPMGNGKCQHHDGKTEPSVTAKVGVFSKHNRRARYLPQRLWARFEELEEDREIYQLREDILLIDTRMTELLDALKNSSGAARLWKRLKSKKNAYIRARSKSNPENANRYLVGIFEIIDLGATDFQTWQSILELIEARRKVVESERKRMVEAQQMMSTQQAMLFMKQATKIIQDNVQDEKTLMAISLGFSNLIESANGPLS